MDKRNQNLAANLSLLGTYQDTQNFRTVTTQEHFRTKSHVDKIHHDIKEIGFREEVESIQLRKLRKRFQSQLATWQKLTEDLRHKMKTTTPMKTYQNDTNVESHQTSSSNIWKETPKGYGSLASLEETQKLIANSELKTEWYSGEEEEIIRLGEMMQDVNDVFEDLKSLINDQQSEIDDIETRVQITQKQVEAGQEELLKSQIQKKKMRKRRCCFLIALLLAGLIIGLTLYLTSD